MFPGQQGPGATPTAPPVGGAPNRLQSPQQYSPLAPGMTSGSVGQLPPTYTREQLADFIIKNYETQLKQLTDRNCRDAVDREKIYQYAMVRRNDFYYRGNQHLAPTFTGTGELVDFKPVNNQLLLRATSGLAQPNSTIYDYVINHFRGDLRKFVAVLGNKAPNVTARPAWQRDDNGTRRANIANDCAGYLRQQWDVDAANRYLCLSLGKNGTTFLHTPFVADADRYGTHREPVWGMIPQKVSPDQYTCRFCGATTPGPSPFPSSSTENPENSTSSSSVDRQNADNMRNLGQNREISTTGFGAPGPTDQNPGTRGQNPTQNPVITSVPNPFGQNSDNPDPSQAQSGTPPPNCPTCGMPLAPEDWSEGQTQQIPGVTGYKDYPNGTVELHVYSTYNVTTPFYLHDLATCPWLFVDAKEDASVLVSRFPGRGLESDIGQDRTSTEAFGGSAKSLGDLARLQASSPTGYGMIERPNRWDYSRFWIRPHMYWYLVSPQIGATDGPKLADLLKQNFPRGLKLTFANKRLVEVEHERLDEVWAAVKPETSEYLFADPIFNDYIQGADVMNDAWNIQIQLLETSIPALIFDPNILDPRKIRNGFQPNEFVPTIPGSGTLVEKSFFRIPTSDPKPETVNFQKVVIDTLREIVGLLPPIWGGDENVQTAEQARRRLNQALMVLATTWNEIRKGWSTAYRNGVRQLARYSLGRLVSSQGDPESVTVRDLNDIQELLDGGWDFECDQAIPMNWTQLRDFVGDLFQMNPAMAHALGADDPDNVEKISEGIGLPGWKIRGVDEYKRIRDLIARLQQDSPIPGQPDPMTGIPGQDVPSIPIDFSVEYNPQTTISVIHDWFMSEDGRSAEGTPGYANVLAAGKMALAAMQPPMPPPGAAPPHPPGAGVGPPGAHPLPPPGANPTAPAGPADQQLPGPLQPTQPIEAPEQPLMPLNPPPGNFGNIQPLVQ